MKQKLFDTISAFEQIIICRHERPDPDAIGSQAGLARLIEINTGKKVQLAGEEEPSLSFLSEMDKIDDKAFSEALVIVCDTANTGRIDDERYKNARELFKIDHHPVVDDYASLAWVDPTFSSTSEMIVHWYETVASAHDWKLDGECARLLYAGIVGDTGRFSHPNTSACTFKAVQLLFEREFDVRRLFNEMYKKPLSLLRLEGEVLSDFTLSENGVGVIVLSQEQLRKYQVSVNESSAIVHSVANVEGIMAWVTFVELEDKTYRVRLRSKGPVVNELAGRFQGGGHPLAAGATAENDQERAQVVEQLEEICKAYRA
ncbi:bifunctional oligoribonuclease/PAP phosphatase NrnA [Salicibibacter cibarius]|uniref:Bifunctional oligoribonuclease/PAP phosphatase NrnA n=1 Tax=Salicibibacter cibarius TaxID=2743000 RepID=A0A7T7CCT3_9BACI|nr:bifunctional oligoribonuclease/PAP phosphatase NrnA [Salicibibacter cibarius]QQK77297.1 bifunctional oligoribonuclease/PAP phosphatase NrnA [Salicibibacter cibarius]